MGSTQMSRVTRRPRPRSNTRGKAIVARCAAAPEVLSLSLSLSPPLFLSLSLGRRLNSFLVGL